MTTQTVNVATLMWLRTIISHQYLTGLGIKESAVSLYKDGGIKRYYRGAVPALAQSSMIRFIDASCNESILSIAEVYPKVASLPVSARTAATSTFASILRCSLMPLDTYKICRQVYGDGALDHIKASMRLNGFGFLFNGVCATMAASFIGTYSWYFAYNKLNTMLPVFSGRSLVVGLLSSTSSDIISNHIRVLKTTKQALPVV